MAKRLRLNINDYSKGLSAAEYQTLFLKKTKRTKFNNVATVVNHEKFQSKKEATCYQDLCWQKELGHIHDFKCQVSFRLIPATKGSVRKYGEKSYVADFVIYNKDNTIASVIDVKPDTKGKTKNRLSRTAKYQMSIHLFYLKYGIEVEER